MGFSGKLREILAAGLGWRKFKDIKMGSLKTRSTFSGCLLMISRKQI